MTLEQTLALLTFLAGLGLAGWRAGSEFQRLRHAVEHLQEDFAAVHQRQAEQAAIHDDLQSDLTALDQQLQRELEQLREQLANGRRHGRPFGPTA